MSDYQIQTENLAFKTLEGRPIAFFCAEYGLEDFMPAYAGGLGVLAGDLFMEAGTQGVPFVAMGLFYHHGFATYTPNSKDEETYLNPQDAGFALLKTSDGQPVEVQVQAMDRMIHVQVWARIYKSAHMLLLDTDVEPNSPEDRKITDYLYPADVEKKLLQEIVLGLGSTQLLRQLNISPSVYHLNEGHTALVALGLLSQHMLDHPEEPGLHTALDKIRTQIVATKHTVLAAAGIYADRQLLVKVMGGFFKKHNINFDDLFVLGSKSSDPNYFSTTRFLLRVTHRTNAVSMLHAIFEKRIHPESQLIPITNGVNRQRWALPQLSYKSMKLSDLELWKIHDQQRQQLIGKVQEYTGKKLDADALTVVWAKRFASYKRLAVLFSNPERLAKIVANKDYPVNFIIAGNASIVDPVLRQLLISIFGFSSDLKFADHIVYLPKYSITIAQELTRGADVWLNTPIRGKEASGTSGMKAGLNGALQFSISDGWIEEVDLIDKGWILPDENIEEKFYDILEQQIVPMFYNRTNDLPTDWIKRMRNTIYIVNEQYTTRRMLEEYLNRLYFPSPDKLYKLSK